MKWIFAFCTIFYTAVSFSQNVGVGTPSPVEKLDVNGGIRLGTTSGTNYGTMRFNVNTFEGYENGYWTPMQVPKGTLITVSDTGNLLQSGFFVAGLEQHTVSPYYGMYPGKWLNVDYSTGGQYFGSPDMVFVNGQCMLYYNNYIYKLDPATNVWTHSSVNTVGGFSSRFASSIVWTGTELIIYGGFSGLTTFNDGVKYNPLTDTWSAIANAPVKRERHNAVWTGTDMIIFGGDSIASGGSCTGAGFTSNKLYKYNPGSNTWSGPLATTGTAPSARFLATAVWTGTEMLVFGGEYTSDGTCAGTIFYLQDNFSFNPATNAWTGKSPGTFYNSSARGAWTGSKMLVWLTSGVNASAYLSGYLFDPVTNTWSSIANENAFLGSGNTAAAWTGTKFLLTTGPQVQQYDPTGMSRLFGQWTTNTYYLLQKL